MKYARSQFITGEENFPLWKQKCWIIWEHFFYVDSLLTFGLLAGYEFQLQFQKVIFHLLRFYFVHMLHKQCFNDYCSHWTWAKNDYKRTSQPVWLSDPKLFGRYCTIKLPPLRACWFYNDAIKPCLHVTCFRPLLAMDSSPILSVIQPVNIDTMPRMIEEELHNLLKLIKWSKTFFVDIVPSSCLCSRCWFYNDAISVRIR